MSKSCHGGWGESDVQRLEDDRVVEVCTQDSEGERLQEGKSGQENEVEWVLMAFPVEQAEIDEDTEHGDIVRPRARLAQYNGTGVWIRRGDVLGLDPEDCGWGLRKQAADDSCGELCIGAVVRPPEARITQKVAYDLYD